MASPQKRDFLESKMYDPNVGRMIASFIHPAIHLLMNPQVQEYILEGAHQELLAMGGDFEPDIEITFEERIVYPEYDLETDVSLYDELDVAEFKDQGYKMIPTPFVIATITLNLHSTEFARRVKKFPTFCSMVHKTGVVLKQNGWEDDWIRNDKIFSNQANGKVLYLAIEYSINASWSMKTHQCVGI